MPKIQKMPNKNRFNEPAYQDKLRRLGTLALDVVEALLTDTETPIDVRLNTAFRIVEMSSQGGASKQEMAVIIQGIENNARRIESNAHELAYIQTLIKRGFSMDNESIVETDNIKEQNIPDLIAKGIRF
ncbi:MAG: hypothetical protein DRQ49_12335 [Gammaproteobacteria bacterium]|nr:MAG: hypothetical protein DRQ49_12335 [Gammaproteobacteria bacterium]RKZ71588.1 MAG: hypothetical protein DRQ57_18445 [Gammaproteobacteria bacterium]